MKELVNYQEEILISVAIVLTMLSLMFLFKRALQKFSFVKAIDANRKKVVLLMSYLFVYFLFGTMLAIVWGVDFHKLSIFISSILAVLGVGFVAQWSLLSNLTASAILFFNHPVRIGSRIRILDKDFNLTGEVKDITGFYFFIKTDEGKLISFPNNMIMQKGIEILQDKKETN